jgi:predicted TIM-barrel fold metal-dependent hydrolase
LPSIVDIHPHVISPDPKRFPLNPLGGTQSTWSRDRPTPYEALVSAMDEAGVDKAAIVQASTAYGHDNSYVAEAIAAVPSALPVSFPSMCWRLMPWKR